MRRPVLALVLGLLSIAAHAQAIPDSTIPNLPNAVPPVGISDLFILDQKISDTPQTFQTRNLNYGTLLSSMLGAGSSGQVPIYQTGGTLAPVGPFPAGRPLIGAGTSGIAAGTVTGNTTAFAATSGTFINGHCRSTDANLNEVDAGGACSVAMGNPLLGPNVNNVIAYGADPTGASSSATAFINAITAALAGPNGGAVYAPCGNFSFAGTVTVTIPTNKVLTMIGGGPDCTVISSTSGGTPFHITKADTTGSFHLRDFTLAATAPNSGNGIILDITGVNSTSSVMSDITNVTLRGNTSTTEDVNYYVIGIRVIGVSGINFTNVTAQGDLARGGSAISLQGNASGAFGIVYNFVNCNFFFNGIGLFYGAGIQGVQITASNFTGNSSGIQTASGATGLFELVISSTQFQNLLADISFLSVVADVNISSSEFGPFTSNTGFCSICGIVQNAGIVGNTFINGTGATSNDALNLLNGSDSIAVSANSFKGHWDIAVVFNAGVTNANLQSNVYNGPTVISSPATTTGSVRIGGGSS